MKRFILTLLFIVTISCNSFAQSVDYLDKSAFKAGETIKYKLKYGFITAAEATLQVLATDVKINNKPTYHC